jgi:hypothetical protein
MQWCSVKAQGLYLYLYVCKYFFWKGWSGMQRGVICLPRLHLVMVPTFFTTSGWRNILKHGYMQDRVGDEKVILKWIYWLRTGRSGFLGSISGGNWEVFSTTSRAALGRTQPPIQWIPGALSLGIK